MPGKTSRDFHLIFEEHLLRSHIPLAVIASQSGISRRTLHRWFVNTLPKNYLALLKVLAFVHLSEKETDELLELAGFSSLSELRRMVGKDVQGVLQAWPVSRPAPNQSLPSPNYFVGRRDLIEDIKRSLLVTNGLKLVGLRGLGGAGKTTLAKRLAEVLEPDFPDGILWGELHQSDTEAILTQFAGDYGEDLTQYSSLASKASLVRSLLRHKRVLIVLDNAESDEQLKYLLPPKASSCAILITSRKKLKTLRGWPSIEIRGFDPKDSLLLFQVFLGKNRLVRHQSTLAHVSDQLGHLPLAVLILASYLQFRPDEDIEQLPQILKDRKARMNLLHADEDESVRLTFELSWEGLSEVERQNLVFLSQFAGRNFSTSAVSAMWNVPIHQTKRRLTNLANLSLVEIARDERWGLHPLIHDYLSEKMEAHYGEQRRLATRRLVEHFTDSIQKGRTSGYRHLVPDLDNIIHALDDSYAHHLWELLARSAPSALNLFETFGRYDAIDHLADKAIVAAERLEDDATLAALFYCLAAIDNDGYMNYTRAAERANLGLALAREIEDWTLVCEFNFILAQAAWMDGNADLEKQYWAEVERLAKPRQLEDILLRLAQARAWRALWYGDYDFAERTLAKFIQYTRRSKKTKLLWRAYDYLAYVFYRKGDFRNADANYAQALDVAYKADGLRPVTVLLGCAQNALAWGKPDLAQAYADEALNLTKSVMRPLDILDAHIYSSDVALAREDYTGARELLEKALQISRTSRTKAKECVTLARLGRLCVLEGDLPEAERFLELAMLVTTRFRESTLKGYVYEQFAFLAAAKGQIQQAIIYGEKCLEIYDQMRLREAADIRKWLVALRKQIAKQKPKSR